MDRGKRFSEYVLEPLCANELSELLREFIGIAFKQDGFVPRLFAFEQSHCASFEVEYLREKFAHGFICCAVKSFPGDADLDAILDQSNHTCLRGSRQDLEENHQAAVDLFGGASESWIVIIMVGHFKSRSVAVCDNVLKWPPYREARPVTIKIGSIEVGRDKPFLIIAGPCVMESWDIVFKTAERLKDLSRKHNFSLVFKSSYDKANRTSIDSYRGPGIEDGLAMLAELKAKTGLPVLSDVHETSHCVRAQDVLDVLQIPAFLCRQTDLLVAAAQTGRCVNIKKGQFVAPDDMNNAVKKVFDAGNKNVFLTERGTTFGYNNLVVDMRSIPMMQAHGVPVIYDATHSVQLPGGGGNVSHGLRQYIPHLTRAAVAAGCDGVFMEVHPDPDQAKSDGPNQVPLAQVEELIEQILKVHNLVDSLPKLELPQAGKCKEVAIKV